METNSLIYKTFEKGSITFFSTTLFFPKRIREDVFTLYAFVRTADDFIDTIPQKIDEFNNFKELYHKALKGENVDNYIIEKFVELMHRKSIKPEWVEAFFDSMISDISLKEYKTFSETLSYIYGSAQVIGLMMCRILNLPESTYIYAELLGKAFQYINFIRDINEDNFLGRRYFPKEELEKYGLENLTSEYIKENKEKFVVFMKEQLKIFREWSQEAKAGFKFIPKRLRIPIKTASDLFEWTANKIEENPFLVFEKKVKPSKARIYTQIILNALKF